MQFRDKYVDGALNCGSSQELAIVAPFDAMDSRLIGRGENINGFLEICGRMDFYTAIKKIEIC